MLLNPDHPRFDYAMEVLAAVSLKTGELDFFAFRGELGLRHAHWLKIVTISAAQSHGIRAKIGLGNKPKLAVNRHDLPKLEAVCDAYWDRVYGSAA